jgi:hypothetical protein
MANTPQSKEFEMSYSRLLSPDFSDFIREGKFDGVHALQSHLASADFLLRTAEAMVRAEETPALPSLEDRLYVIEANLATYREAVEAAVVEVNRLGRIVFSVAG